MDQKERENSAIYDEYDNGPVTPGDQLAPDVKEHIAKIKRIVEKSKAGKKPSKA